MEMAVGLDRLLQVLVSASTVKFRWSSAVVRVLFSCSLLGGEAVHGSPVPEIEGWRFRRLKIWRRKAMLSGLR